MDILPRVLIVEDQLSWRRLYKIWLKGVCEPTFCTSHDEALQSMESSTYDVVIMDLGLPDPEIGLQTIRDLLQLDRLFKIIVVTSFGNRELHRQTQEMGAYAVFQKDERLESELPIFIRKAYEMLLLEKENQYLREQFSRRAARVDVLGHSRQAQNLREQIENLARSDTPVLLVGPTGAGKNFYAHLIHLRSPRASKPYLVINCANLVPTLLESELFGYTRGAFTGADRSHIGKFKAADGGTVLLDEIGELPLHIQAKLLQVIEEKSFYPLGSHERVSVNVRIVAATNRNLQQLVEEGRFRQDLYYRLAGFTIHIPSLAQRPEDIPEFFDFFLKKICQEEDLPVPEVEPDVYQALKKFSWPGNVRELKHLITRLLVFHPRKITLKELLETNGTPEDHLIERASFKNYSLKEMAALYAQHLYRRIRQKKKVAEILQVDIKTLNRYLNMPVGERKKIEEEK